MDNSSSTQSVEISIERSSPKAKNRWKLLKNAIRASTLFKTHEIEVIKDVDEFCDQLSRNPTRLAFNRAESLTTSAIWNHKILDQLFFHVKRSNSHDLEKIKELINSHPLKYIRSQQDPEYFLNKPDSFGNRPIYEASRNGYLETVKLLLDNGANPRLSSNGENCLQASSRWNHFQVVKLLVESFRWTSQEIKIALKETNNAKIIEILKKCPTTKSRFCGCIA